MEKIDIIRQHRAEIASALEAAKAQRREAESAITRLGGGLAVLDLLLAKLEPTPAQPSTEKDLSQ